MDADPVLYRAVHYVVYQFADGSTSASCNDLNEAFEVADAHNSEHDYQPGDSGFALVHTEYHRDDEFPGRRYRWRLHLDEAGSLAIPEYADVDYAIKRGALVEGARGDVNPTVQVWHADALGTRNTYEITVVARNRRAALKKAREILEAAQTPAENAAEIAAEFIGTDKSGDRWEVPEYAESVTVGPMGHSIGLGDPDQVVKDPSVGPATTTAVTSSPMPTYAINLEFPRTPRGYPYEGPQNTPGSSNVDIGAGAPLAVRIDADMGVLEDRLAALEARHSKLVTTFAKAEAMSGVLYPWERSAQLAGELIDMIERARDDENETDMEFFTAAFIADDRIHPDAASPLADAVVQLVPLLWTAMEAQAKAKAAAEDGGDRGED